MGYKYSYNLVISTMNLQEDLAEAVTAREFAEARSGV